MRSTPAVIILGSIVAAGALMWPALYNGQPFFFPDTTAYIRAPDAALQKLTGLSSPWAQIEDDGSAANAQAPPGEVPAPPSVSSIKTRPCCPGARCTTAPCSIWAIESGISGSRCWCRPCY